jgi:hypothetical protein
VAATPDQSRPGPALLEVHDVTKSFGAVAAVQGVSFPCTRARPTPWSARTARASPPSATDSRDLKLWFADGINCPGQDDLRNRQDRLAAALRET